MAHPDWKAWVAQATEGLRADPELRADVARELESHLEEAADAARREGEAGPEALALRTMGAVTEAGEGLAEANAARMRLRARIRRALMSVALPAAVAVAVGVAGGTVRRFWFLSRALPVQGGRDGWAENGFLFTGDLSRARKSDQQRAIWEQAPDDPVFRGNYLAHRILEDLQPNPSPGALDPLVKELEEAVRDEPDNAYYAYLLAAAHLAEATTWVRAEEGQPARTTVRDPGRLDAGISTLSEAGRRPAYRRYLREMLRRRLATLPNRPRAYDRLRRLLAAAGTILPDVGPLLRLVEALPGLAGHLAAEGRTDEAESVLRAWEPLATGMLGEAFTLIDVLVIRALVARGSESEAEYWDGRGQPDRAAAVRLRGELMGAPVDEWKERRTADSNGGRAMQRHHSTMASFWLPALGAPVDPVRLAPGRRAEYALAEQGALAGLLAVQVLVMLGLGLLVLRWRRVPGAGAAPFLLVPGWRVWLLILGGCVAAPLIAYAAYSTWAPWNLRDTGLWWSRPRIAAEFHLFGVTLILLPSLAMTRYVRGRCAALDVPRPRRLPRALVASLVGLVALAWLAVMGIDARNPPLVSALCGVLVGLPGLGMFSLGLVQFARMLWPRGRWGLYYGTVARTLLAAMACVSLVTAALVRPWVEAWERRSLVEDTLLTPVTDGGGFTAVESELTRNLQESLRQAFRDAPTR